MDSTYLMATVLNMIPWILENDQGEEISPITSIDTVMDGAVSIGPIIREMLAKLDALLTDSQSSYNFDNIYKIMRDIAALVQDSNIPRFFIAETLPAVSQRNVKTTYAKSASYTKEGRQVWYIERLEDSTGKSYDIKDVTVDEKIKDLQDKMNAKYINDMLAAYAPVSTTLHAKYLVEGGNKHSLGDSIKYSQRVQINTSQNLDTLLGGNRSNIRCRFIENAIKHASFPTQLMSCYEGYFEQELTATSHNPNKGFQKIITDNGEEITRVYKGGGVFGPWKITYNSGGNNDLVVSDWTIKQTSTGCLGFFYNG